jgi:hypothetical protein
MTSTPTEILPQLPPTGTPEQCRAAIAGQVALGCDGVILHGATPAELEPILTGWDLAAG